MKLKTLVKSNPPPVQLLHQFVVQCGFTVFESVSRSMAEFTSVLKYCLVIAKTKISQLNCSQTDFGNQINTNRSWQNIRSCLYFPEIGGTYKQSWGKPAVGSWEKLQSLDLILEVEMRGKRLKSGKNNILSSRCVLHSTLYSLWCSAAFI